MSGIFGIISFDGQPVSSVDLNRMAAKMAHRGLDSSTLYVEKNVGFGHLMLHSTEESLREQLPLKEASSGLLITADARIDNRDKLIHLLSVDSSESAPVTDSQLILAAFTKWGKECVGHLLGDFSFAIGDKRKRRLFVARDHMGLRPFYYHSYGDLFVFASTAAAIVQVSRVPNQINEGRIADFLVEGLEGINKTCTFFSNVFRMPPAHFGTVESKKVKFRNYWQPDPGVRLNLSSDDDYADALEDVLGLAIKARFRSHYPVASMLSGGVDSSAIVGLSRKICQDNGYGPFRTYSGVSNTITNCCESGFIQMMLDHGGLDPVLLRSNDLKKYGSKLTRISNIIEDPFDESWSMLHLIYLSAREHGNIIVMDGMGGDLVAGLMPSYPNFLFRQGQIKRALSELQGLRKNFYEGQIEGIIANVKSIRSALTPDILRRFKSNCRNSKLSGVDIGDSLISKEFMKKVDLSSRWHENMNPSKSGISSSLQYSHAETIVIPYQTAAIERYTRIAGYHGVESRQPFFDKRVVELCLSLPWQQKAQNGWLKYCLRNVLQRVAPAEVAWRSRFDSIMWKFGVAHHEQQRMKNISTISENREQLLTMIDANWLDQTFRRYKNGETQAVNPIWKLVTLLNWLKSNQEEVRI